MRHLWMLMLMTALGAACNRAATPAARSAAEPPTLDVTSWTDKTELFMEHPPLVAGQRVRFAVHLTKLQEFKALDEGKPRVILLGAGTWYRGLYAP